MSKPREANGRLAKLLVIGFLAMVLNTSYLVSSVAPTFFHYSNVAFHILAGFVLALLLIFYLVRNFSAIPLVAKMASALLIIGSGVGAALFYIYNTHNHRSIFLLHIAVAVAGAVLMMLFLLTRSRRAAMANHSLAKLYVVIVIAALALPIAARAYDRAYGNRYRITNPLTAPDSMDGEGGGPSSPFYPSSARTNVGTKIDSKFFMTAESCARCHKEIYDQWNASVHHFGSFNNQWYRKSIEYMQDTIGTQSSKWCAGCHDHAVFFNGRFDQPIKEQIDTPEAQNGLSCTSCHSIVHVGSSMGNGDFTIEYPPLHDLAASDNPILQKAHDLLTYADPTPHKQLFLKDFHKEDTAEFCSSCHKVHLDKPVNHYRWIRGFNDYDNWQASGVSGQGARSFYYPPKSQKCADCHMPMIAAKDPAAQNGMVHSHRFPGANTALPFVNHDQTQFKEVENFLKSGAVTIDVFGISKAAPVTMTQTKKAQSADEQEQQTTFAVGEESLSYGGPAFISEPAEVYGPLDKINASVRRGDSMRLDVVVRTRKIGHFFPGGTVDAFDVWVELQAVDDHGKTIFWSGEVEDNGTGPVEKGAHFYRSLLLDEHGNPINKRNAWAARSTAYVRLIPPGAADTIHYRLNIPADCGDKIHITAKLNYRKFAWWNTQWAYAGVPGPGEVGPSFDDRPWSFTGDTSKVSGGIKAIPNIPIVTMSESSADLNVIGKDAPAPENKPFLDKSVRERWNDYGIGLLLQGDIKGAEAAFLKVTQMEPGYVDGWVNIGRARVQEGEIEAAQEVLKHALDMDPNLARTNFFYAMTLKAQGKYDEALTHLRTAASQYPRDRVVANQLGRILFLKRQYNEAIAELQKVFSVDPEDLQGHYTMMLCYQGVGNQEMANKERVLYQRFKADESAQAITGPFRKLHAEDNNERQQIHEHVSIPLGPPAKPASETKRYAADNQRVDKKRSVNVK